MANPNDPTRTDGILFVCHGNICRSPMAEFVMKDLLRKAGIDVPVESCATSREELGNDIYPPAKRVMEAHGIPFETRRARQMVSDDYYRFSIIAVMDSENLRNIRPFVHGDPEGKVRRLLSFCGTEENVSDPWYTGDFETCYRDVLRGCEGILEHIRSRRSRMRSRRAMCVLSYMRGYSRTQ